MGYTCAPACANIVLRHANPFGQPLERFCLYCMQLPLGPLAVRAASASIRLVRSVSKLVSSCSCIYSGRMVLLMPCSGQLVNQFPYEGAIVRKDLLPQTARRLLRLRDGTAEDAADPTEAFAESPASGRHPWWLPATYDLATEVHFFLEDYHKVLSFAPCYREALPDEITSTWLSNSAGSRSSSVSSKNAARSTVVHLLCSKTRSCLTAEGGRHGQPLGRQGGAGRAQLGRVPHGRRGDRARLPVCLASVLVRQQTRSALAC